MKNICDLHTHTVLSNHGYSSLTENINQAIKLNLKYLGTSEHQPDEIGLGATRDAFNALNHVPEVVENLTILKGCEFNILENGFIDPRTVTTETLDYGIASIHDYAYKYANDKENITNCYLNVLDYDYIKILGHIHDVNFPCDFEKIVVDCKKKHKLIEINNSKLHSKNIELTKELISICQKYQQPIIVNSDAHILYEIAQVDKGFSLLDESGYSKDLVLNFNEELFKEYFEV